MSTKNSSANHREQQPSYGFQSVQVRENQDEDDDDRNEDGQPHRNVQVLIFVVTLFSTFVIAEVIAAFSSHSLSLLGDAGATGVDVFTYICNIFAEKLKGDGKQVSIIAKWLVDVVIPTFSLFWLVAVAAYVALEAVEVLTSERPDEDVDVYTMYIFAAANVLIDVASIGALYWSSGDSGLIRGHLGHFEESAPSTVSGRVTTPPSDTVTVPGCANHCHVITTRQRADSMSEVNLNMMSAFAHIAGDSLRTVAMIIAATISLCFGISGEVCDAWSAIIATLTLFAFIMPLVKGIVKSAKRLLKKGARLNGDSTRNYSTAVVAGTSGGSAPV